MEYKIGDLVRIKKYEDVCKSDDDKLHLNKRFFDAHAGKLCTIKAIENGQYEIIADSGIILYARTDCVELVEEPDVSSWNELFKGV